MSGNLPSVSIDELRRASVAPLPKDILVREKVDHAGEDSLEAIFVFPNGAGDDDMRYKTIRPMQEAVRKLLQERDPLKRFVYFRARRSKELTPADRA